MSNHATTSTPHVLPLKIYLGVGAILLTLTVTTVLVSEIQLGGWNLVAALAIAATKALLVAFFFMHLYYDYKLYFFIFSIAVSVLAIFIVFTMFDTLDRGAIYEIKGQPINPKASMYSEPIFQGQGAAVDTSKAKAPAKTGDTSGVKTDTSTARKDTTQQAKPPGY